MRTLPKTFYTKNSHFCTKNYVSFLKNQGCGSRSGLDPDSATLWIGIRIPNTDPDPDPGVRKLRNFIGKMHFLVIFNKNFNTKKV
jgi:hypothetical protein